MLFPDLMRSTQYFDPTGTGDRQHILNLVDIVHLGPSGHTVRLVLMDELLRSFSEAGGQGFGESLVASRFKQASPFQIFFFMGSFSDGRVN